MPVDGLLGEPDQWAAELGRNLVDLMMQAFAIQRCRNRTILSFALVLINLTLSVIHALCLADLAAFAGGLIFPYFHAFS